MIRCIGQVIKGWDTGVATMKKGEKSVLTIKSEYGYGAGGTGNIPGGATLIFEVELLSWVDSVDITKDGGVVKKVLRESEDYVKPKDDSVVTLNYKLKLEDGTLIEEQKDFKFVVGAEEVIEGLEQGVKDMKKSEKALLTIKPNYAYQDKGLPAKNIPPGATLRYEIELVDFTKEKESWEMTTEQKLLPAKRPSKKAMNSTRYAGAPHLPPQNSLPFFQYRLTSLTALSGSTRKLQIL